MMHTCCRDGNKRGPNKTGKTRKIRDSHKLQNCCLARMIVTECLDEGRVYISTHTNHTVEHSELKYLPIHKSVKEDICQQFAAGISLERIMDSKYIAILCSIYCIDVRRSIGMREQCCN